LVHPFPWPSDCTPVSSCYPSIFDTPNEALHLDLLEPVLFLIVEYFKLIFVRILKVFDREHSPWVV